MSRVHEHPNVVYAAGSLVVLTDEVSPLGRATVATIIRSPPHAGGEYRVRAADGREAVVGATGLRLVRADQEDAVPAAVELASRVVISSVVGSRAYGLETAHSDTDRKGLFVPPAAAHWSLGGVPEQIEDDARQAVYWELQKFLRLCLRANPTALEVLYSPLVERAEGVGEELVDQRRRFLSTRLHQTVSGYAMSQFRKIEADVRNRGAVRWKHAMHLIRLLHAAVACVRQGDLTLTVGDELREKLLSVKRGEVPWEDVDAWRLRLHAEFEEALPASRLPERPDAAWANDVLIRARRAAAEE